MRKTENNRDYAEREYLSVVEASHYTGIPVTEIHNRIKNGHIIAFKSTSGQYRLALKDIENFRNTKRKNDGNKEKVELNKFGTRQTIFCSDSRNMHGVADESVHLAITSPPYFNAKMYSDSKSDLGNIHDLEEWLSEISEVWKEVYRVVQPGRKFFLNIMNLPIRQNKTFKTLNLVGKNIDLCESIGFIFKRDIVWHKTNGVRAHFGTYPYPGGILLNHMHEFILEFEKPMHKARPKYPHVTQEQKEMSKLDKDFWLSIKNSDVWLMKPEKSGASRSHAAPFPLEMPSRLIRAYSYVGESVIDPFMGSGTTLLASSILKRNGIGFEINSDFCDMAINSIRSIML